MLCTVVVSLVMLMVVFVIPCAGASACVGANSGARICASPWTSRPSLLPRWQAARCLELHPLGAAVRI